MKLPDGYTEFKKHISEEMSPELIEYINEGAMAKCYYIFMEGKGKTRTGYCTHCKNEFEMEPTKHKSIYRCPFCVGDYQVRSAGMSRKTFIDRRYFTWFEKSLIDPNTIIAKGIHVIRDYRNDYRNVVDEYELYAAYIFEYGVGAKMIVADGYYGYWHTRETINDATLNRTYLNAVNVGVNYNSFYKSIADTSFKYIVGEEDYKRYLGHFIKYLNLYSKYGLVEKLMKVGLDVLVDDKIFGHRTYGMVKWKKDSIYDALGLNRQQLKEFMELPLYWGRGCWGLAVYKESRKLDPKIKISEIDMLAGEAPSINDIRQIAKSVSLRKVCRYLEKQRSNIKYGLVSTYRDYLNDCRILGFDMNSNSVLYPKNLYNAHQNTIAQVKVKNDKELNEKITERAKVLEKLGINGKNFIIRPVTDMQELIDEGKTLHHCVGTYAKKYAGGECDIYTVRAVEELDKPLVTVEVRKGEIAQARADYNKTPSDEVNKFLNGFRKKINKKKKLVEVM